MRVFLSSSLPARIPTIPPDAFFSQNEKKRNNKKKQTQHHHRASLVWFHFRLDCCCFFFICLFAAPEGAVSSDRGEKTGGKRVLITRDHAPRHGLSSHLYRVQAKENRLCGVWYAFSTTVTFQNRTAVLLSAEGEGGGKNHNKKNQKRDRNGRENDV